MFVLASGPVRTRAPVVVSRLAMVLPSAVLMSETTVAALSPALIVTGVVTPPIVIDNVPPTELAGTATEPVTTAAASGDKVAPLPRSLAAVAAPTTGLAEK